MTLYEISQEMQNLVNPDTGEIEDYEAFSALQMERDEKIENTGLWIKNLNAESAAIKVEEEALRDRRKGIERRAESLKALLGRELCGEKFQTPRLSITFRRTSSVAVDDEGKLIEWLESHGMDDCLRYKAPEISKTALGGALKQGADIPYAHIEDKLSMGVK